MDQREYHVRESLKQVAAELEEHNDALPLGTREEYERANLALTERRLQDATIRWVHEAKVARFSGNRAGREYAREQVEAQLERVALQREVVS